ncbi:mitochondrial carrier [Dendrothele bispora CBS 962.96]|uniref:Mitochondrial carrier n=1 Tax=Dendrothele bispora (strain CBS 962.96) TaxID=1314807 RepID=A0A4S8L6D5_DENBC|nr:mitochondrial carrier [Dendrothele bispora CBS 962.96]
MSVQSKPVKLTPFGAALAGALGGCFSTAVVYPLDVAKTRIQALPKGKGKDNLSMFAVLVRIFQKEGIAGWYKGFGATMLNTFSMQYAYFFFYSFVRNSYISRLTARLPKGSKLPPLSTAMELLLGAIAGALAQIFTIPVSVIATRQQVGRLGGRNNNNKSSSSSKANSAVSSRTTTPAPSPTPNQNGSSSLLPTTTTTVNSDSEEEKTDDSFLAVGREIIEEEGVTGLWLGLRPGLVLTVNPAITYGVYERVKSIVLLAKSSENMSPWLSFIVGAFSKTLATVVTYPYIMAKVRIQARSADAEDAVEHHADAPKAHQYHHDHSRHPGAVDILKRVWKKEGFVGWYQLGIHEPFFKCLFFYLCFLTFSLSLGSVQGMQAQIIKAVLSQALLFMSKEQFERWTLAIMILAARVASRGAVAAA